MPLITQEGETVLFYDDLIKDKRVLINFMYETCEKACPLATAKMAQLQRALGPRIGRDIFMYSITLEPEHDTPEVLKAYSKRYGAGPGWLFLTGDRDEIYRLARRGFLLGVDATPGAGTEEEPIFHSTRFVLVDGGGRIRGYYNALNVDEIDELAVDLLRLLDEEEG